MIFHYTFLCVACYDPGHQRLYYTDGTTSRWDMPPVASLPAPPLKSSILTTQKLTTDTHSVVNSVQPISVHLRDRNSVDPAPASETEGYKLFVGNVDPQGSTLEFKQLFMRCGATDAFIVRKRGPVSATHGFASFPSKALRDIALRSRIDFCGRTLKLDIAKPAAAHHQKPHRPRDPLAYKRTIFITGIPYTTTRRDLAQIFSKYHPQSVRLPYDKHHLRIKGYAFVEFESEDSCRTILSTFPTLQIGNRECKLQRAHNTAGSSESDSSDSESSYSLEDTSSNSHTQRDRNHSFDPNTHQAPHPFICGSCKQTFPTKEQFVRHFQKAHPN